MKKLLYVVGAFIFYKNSLLLIKHADNKRWIPIGGHVKSNEELHDALLREIKEETNLKVRILSQRNLNKLNKGEELPLPIRIFKRGNSLGEIRLFFDFLTVTEDVSNFKPDPEEIEDYKWFSKEEVSKSPLLLEEVKLIALEAFRIYESFL